MMGIQMMDTPPDEEEEHLVSPYMKVIAFDLPEYPPWHQDDSPKNKETPISSKLMDICNYQLWWKDRVTKVNNENLKKVQRDMLHDFVLHVNVEEDIGTKEKRDIQQIADNMSCNNNKKLLQRSHSKSEQETINLIRAYECLKRISDEGLEDDPQSLGMLERESCIQEIHKILMKDVIDPNFKTAPGVFSTFERRTTYKGEPHDYPHRKTTAEWDRIIDTIVDYYNSLVDCIKYEKEREKRTAHLFNCVAWFLFRLVSEHPFSDGNGRLCRLLASYTLSVVSPFPTPIYNIYSDTKKEDYIDAIVTARKDPAKEHHPRDLAALIVESNWYTWRKFIDSMGLRNQLPWIC